MTAYLVAGTQAAAGQQNFIILMKMSQVKSTYKEEESDSELSECGGFGDVLL